MVGNRFHGVHSLGGYGEQTNGAQGRPELRGVPWWLLVQTGRYKYIRTLVEDEIEEELYDLEQDPAEQVNLAMHNEHQRDWLSFASCLAELRRTESGMIEHLPPPRSATN